jgi:hypothetical protein
MGTEGVAKLWSMLRDAGVTLTRALFESEFSCPLVVGIPSTSSGQALRLRKNFAQDDGMVAFEVPLGAYALVALMASNHSHPCK